jgi:hypothetical protein
MAQTIRTREMGKTTQTVGNTYDGNRKMKIITTYGYHVRKTAEGPQRAILEELVPQYTECSVCKKFVGKYEEKMAPYMIRCRHEDYMRYKHKMACPDCGRIVTEQAKMKEQEQICFDCFSEMTD